MLGATSQPRAISRTDSRCLYLSRGISMTLRMTGFFRGTERSGSTTQCSASVPPRTSFLVWLILGRHHPPSPGGLGTERATSTRERRSRATKRLSPLVVIERHLSVTVDRHLSLFAAIERSGWEPGLGARGRPLSSLGALAGGRHGAGKFVREWVKCRHEFTGTGRRDAPEPA